jgi:hypothetical protein
VALLPRCRNAGLGHLTGLCLLQLFGCGTPGLFRTSGWRTLTMTHPICGRLLFVAHRGIRMLLFARMARLSHRLGRRSHNSAVAQYQKVIDKHFSKTGDPDWTGQQGGEDCSALQLSEEETKKCSLHLHCWSRSVWHAIS